MILVSMAIISLKISNYKLYNHGITSKISIKLYVINVLIIVRYVHQGIYIYIFNIVILVFNVMINTIGVPQHQSLLCRMFKMMLMLGNV